MDNNVTFVLNITGNANNVLNNINKLTGQTTDSVKNLRDRVSNLANIGFVINHVAGAFRAVNSAVTKFTDAYKAQQPSGCKHQGFERYGLCDL